MFTVANNRCDENLLLVILGPNIQEECSKKNKTYSVHADYSKQKRRWQFIARDIMRKYPRKI
jgi:hypothetical protein